MSSVKILPCGQVPLLTSIIAQPLNWAVRISRIDLIVSMPLHGRAGLDSLVRLSLYSMESTWEGVNACERWCMPQMRVHAAAWAWLKEIVPIMGTVVRSVRPALCNRSACC